MRQTRLVCVEGLPGSGKSTTSWYIASRLREAGLHSRLVGEVEANHPLNVGGPLHPAGSTTGAGLFSRYTVDAYMDESLRLWRSYVAAGESLERIDILDSHPYQNVARVLLQLDAPSDVICRHARDIEQIAQPLTPVLIFLRTEPSAEGFAAIATIRGEAWAAYAIEVLTGCPYARHRGLSGMSGAVAVLRAYDALLAALLAESAMPRLELESCAADWTGCYRRVDEFMEVGLTA